MKIVVASDHAAFELKEAIKEYLLSLKYEVIDVGTNSLESCDYSIYGIKAGEMIKNKQADLGIIACGTGIGISIACNKVKGVRCALVNGVEFAKLTRMHNNANVMALPGRFMAKEEALKCVETFLNTPYEGGRHDRRLNIISEYEKEHDKND